jgi:hypothetical protein
MSLANHYLIFLENENNEYNTGDPGHIEGMFNLGTRSLGSNGFLTMRQKNTPYVGALAPAAGTTDLVNTGPGLGWGNGATSSIGASQEAGGGVIENSGFTAMLVRNNGGASRVPNLGQDLDQNNDGLDPASSDVNDWRTNWTILDAIGVHSEAGEAQYGRLYGNINFGPEATASVEPGATYVGLGYEIEYVGRWGDSTGQTASDWHASNLTDNPASGYPGGADYRQSGDPHPIGGVFDPGFRLESNRGVPYGTPLCRTLGATNYRFTPGDANIDGMVDDRDASILGGHWLAAGATWSMGDFTGDGFVDDRDAAVLAAHWGLGGSGEGDAAFTPIPEPTPIVLALAGLLGLLGLLGVFGLRRGSRSEPPAAFGARHHLAFGVSRQLPLCAPGGGFPM